MKISKEKFGMMNGKEIYEYTLDNENGLVVKIIEYGAIIREINYKGYNRVLGYNTLDEYLVDKNSFGAAIGRVAGRISGAEITIGDDVYKLDSNEGANCLHGGNHGFGKVAWEFHEEIINATSISLVLKHLDKDRENGFPGNLQTYIKYTLGKYNSLVIDYNARSDKDTLITLTNHTYFNLDDDFSDNILFHKLRIDADRYISLDGNSIPLGIKNTEGTVFDFREEKYIGRDMNLEDQELKETLGYDHPFILNKSTVNEIELFSEKSGVRMSVQTTEPVVVVYAGNKFDEKTTFGKDVRLKKYHGIALETQWYPDAINQKFLPDNILKRGEEYHSRTRFIFN
ncbi:MAG: aldose epimerase family protein [Gudongella sp.]|jgi:aldose 1-epimerase|nr:aldose epimerase family protein [Gudongella sp.]